MSEELWIIIVKNDNCVVGLQNTDAFYYIRKLNVFIKFKLDVCYEELKREANLHYFLLLLSSLKVRIYLTF